MKHGKGGHMIGSDNIVKEKKVIKIYVNIVEHKRQKI